MIRFRRLTLALLDAWLVANPIPRASAQYRLRLWREDRVALQAILQELIPYLDEAFDDARRRIRRGFDDELSPFVGPANDPAANYPNLLHRVTLQGYLGEILGGMAVEHWGAEGGNDWAVPAFLFRLHDVEFQHLESLNQRLLAGEQYDPDAPTEQRPGRTGDDCLAFRMNDAKQIVDIITIESKCLGQNSNAKISAAHGKLAASSIRPSGVRELVNLLDEYDTPDAKAWQEALLRLWSGDFRAVGRSDGVAYACGCAPAQGDRVTWLNAQTPDALYTVTRNLEAMEFQLGDLTTLIDQLFRQA
jgi:hypothetical protein